MSRAVPASLLAALQAVVAATVCGQAPALLAPSPLPTDSAAYGVEGLRFGVLLQVRADFPEAIGESSTFFLRKAELAVQARVARATHLSLELDPVRPNDPLRRTYLRLSHIPWMHIKLGMEKAPVGLDELLSSARVPFVDRSEVSDRFSAAEEVGVHLESRWDTWLAQLSVTNGGRRLLRDDNDHKDFSARLVWAPLADVSVGLATLTGRAGPEELTRRRYNAELRVGGADSGAQAELYRARDGAVESDAFYVAVFHAVPTTMNWLPEIQPVLRYEWIDRDDGSVADELSLVTAGASLLVDGHRSKLQVNYLWDLRSEFAADEIRIQYQVEF